MCVCNVYCFECANILAYEKLIYCVKVYNNDALCNFQSAAGVVMKYTVCVKVIELTTCCTDDVAGP